jgi:hypothetical protein
VFVFFWLISFSVVSVVLLGLAGYSLPSFLWFDFVKEACASGFSFFPISAPNSDFHSFFFFLAFFPWLLLLFLL